MNEQIGIVGVLKGIKGILAFKDGDTPELLKTRMENSVSMLDGVIKELTPPPVATTPTHTSSPGIIDPTAEKAKDDLKT